MENNNPITKEYLDKKFSDLYQDLDQSLDQKLDQKFKDQEKIIGRIVAKNFKESEDRLINHIESYNQELETLHLDGISASIFREFKKKLRDMDNRIKILEANY